MTRKEPLYRRVNTRACGVSDGGGEFRWSRHANREDRSSRGSMHDHKRQGLDYTPLFQFLSAKVGADFAEVYREAASRLDRPDPISGPSPARMKTNKRTSALGRVRTTAAST